MPTLVRKLLRFLGYTAATLIILLAVALGLFRLLLPRLPEYQDELKVWASDALGMQVEFAGMDARWGLDGPELQFRSAELIRDGTRIIAADEVDVGLSLTRLVTEGVYIVDRVAVTSTQVELRERADRTWTLQGVELDSLLPQSPAENAADIVVDIRSMTVRLFRAAAESPTEFLVPRALVSRAANRTQADIDVRLPESLGRQAAVGVSILAADGAAAGDVAPRVDVTVDSRGIDLAGWSALVGAGAMPLLSGTADVNASLAIGEGRVTGATADLRIRDALLVAEQPFSADGRAEFRGGSDGWLVALDRFQLTTPNGSWPRGNLRVEASVDDGRVVMLGTNADFIDLADVPVFAPWLPEEHRARIESLAASGRIHDLELTVSDLQLDAPQYTVSARLDGVGFAAQDDVPGIRGFSAELRADQSGGRLELDSREMSLSVPRYLSAIVPVSTATGTLLWRRSDGRTTILSDAITLVNPSFESRSSIELEFGADTGPVVDLSSTWSVSDIAAFKRFIPTGVMNDKLYTWFQDALVAGRIPQGTTRLYGPLRQFPFDAGEGRLLIEANVRDTRFRYHPQWPVAELVDLDVTLDGMRLSSGRNRSRNAGLDVADARVTIDDVRQPLLRIQSTGQAPLAAIREFSRQSPIARVFGGQLDRIDVAGSAAFDLDLTVPIKRWQEFDFTTTVTASGASLQFAGFDPPLTDLQGEVTIGRETISSDGLTATFLGSPVDIELRPAPADRPDYRIVAHGEGTVGAAALVEELAPALDGIIDGETRYAIDVLFPAGGEEPAPVTFELSGDLQGMAIDVPAPLGKPAGTRVNTQAAIRIQRGGERIDSEGTFDGDNRFSLAFLRGDAGWQFDRGTVDFGAGAGDGDTRGLHIRGAVPDIDFDAWLAMSRRTAGRSSAAAGIRSVDLEIGDLLVLGQQLSDHRVRVDRSAQDWLVQFEGPAASGSVFVPYDLGGDRELVLDMDHLHLPGDDDAADDEDAAGAAIDPRGLPAMSIRVADFALGERYFGALNAVVAKIPAGLSVESLTAVDETFDIAANGRWVANDDHPSGSRTHVTGTLSSRNVETTLARLGYVPGIESADMGLFFDLAFDGPPRRTFLATLDGRATLRLGDGQLQEVEPGAGRMFGLMSIVALPRRLSLDFSDVFGKGFGFDEISGEFRIVDGQAYTCNLSLQGPAADIGIVGRVGLAQRDFGQTAVVTAEVGNSLPLVAGVLGGPQAAAAALIFTRIFKKPLEDIGQAYYAIDGSWDTPDVEPSDTSGFAGSAELAGCLAETE